jgi:hypothetical protein
MASRPIVSGTKRLLSAALVALALALVAGAGGAAPEPCPRPFVVPLADRRDEVRCELGEGLVLRLLRAPADTATAGWDVAVTRADENFGPNLLYHSVGWHGPYPSQVMAWHEGKNLFPSERLLAVRGHPLAVTIRVVAPSVAQSGGQRIFTGGRLEAAAEAIAPTEGNALSRRSAVLRKLIVDNLHFTGHLAWAVTGETIRDSRKQVTADDVAPLIALLHDERAAVRHGASGLLAVLGEAARPALEEAARSRDHRAASVAGDALRQIEECARTDPRLMNQDLCPAREER